MEDSLKNKKNENKKEKEIFENYKIEKLLNKYIDMR